MMLFLLLALGASAADFRAEGRPGPGYPAVIPNWNLSLTDRLDTDVFGVSWVGGSGVLKTSAEPLEGTVQEAARAVLAASAVDNVIVPQVFGDWGADIPPDGVPEKAIQTWHGGKHLLLMEKVPGKSLKDLESHRNLGKFLKPVRYGDLLLLKRAFQILHEAGITHGDLEPVNLYAHQAEGRTYFYPIDWEHGEIDPAAPNRKHDLELVRDAIDFFASRDYVKD